MHTPQRVQIDGLTFTIQAPVNYNDRIAIYNAFESYGKAQDETTGLLGLLLAIKTSVKAVEMLGKSLPLRFERNGELADDSLTALLKLDPSTLNRLVTVCFELMYHTPFSFTDSSDQPLDGVDILPPAGSVLN